MIHDHEDGTVCDETDRDPPEEIVEFTCPGCGGQTTESHYAVVENGLIVHR